MSSEMSSSSSYFAPLLPLCVNNGTGKTKDLEELNFREILHIFKRKQPDHALCIGRKNSPSMPHLIPGKF